MPMYWTCQYGVNHDFGEKCDCCWLAKKKKDVIKQMTKIQADGQVALVLSGIDARRRYMH